MSKLSLDVLKERAGAVASDDLLKSISGGTQNACHDDVGTPERMNVIEGAATMLYLAWKAIKL